MSLNLAAIKEIVEHAYQPMIAKEHGDEGLLALREVLHALHKIYQYIDPEICPGPITVFRALDSHAKPIKKPGGRLVINLETLPHDVKGPVVFQVLDGGQLTLWNRTKSNPVPLSKVAVVYTYQGGVERFYANGSNREVPKLFPSCSSAFSIPTFSNLQEAFEHYRIKYVRTSSCPIFSGAWYDGKRFFFKNAPESVMRDSLTRFLVGHFRGDAEVRPEQNVNASRPVDIKVTWWNTKKLALIEIKWLGKSRNKDGRVGVSYGEHRAREGAEQLVDYLDLNRSFAPTHTTVGYLVVIDGRRRNLTAKTTSITARDGLHYEDKEIEYNPEYHRQREDFAEPVRLFVEPIIG